jgi:metalloendopeptidase OMA1, mitochondrial
MLLCCAGSSGCAVSRPIIEPGKVPAPQVVSAQDEEYGQQVLRQFSSQFPLERDDGTVKRVRDMVEHITDAAGGKNEAWHVYVFRAPQVKNAGATRGNFVFVWTGILDSVRSDDELATVLAHEIGHLLAGHTAANPEDQANAMITGVAGVAAQETLRQTLGPAADIARAVVSGLVGAALVNPESQRKELEADQIGLFLMARSGYDPTSAVRFWERVKDDPSFGGGGSLPQFLSSHPSSKTRSERLASLLPLAKRDFRESRVPSYHKQAPELIEKKPSFIIALLGAPHALLLAQPREGSATVREVKEGESLRIECKEGVFLKVSGRDRGFIPIRMMKRPSKPPPPCG